MTIAADAEVPFLVYEVVIRVRKAPVTRVARHGQFNQVSENEPDQIAMPGHVLPPTFEMIVRNPTGEFTKEAESAMFRSGHGDWRGGVHGDRVAGPGRSGWVLAQLPRTRYEGELERPQRSS